MPESKIHGNSLYNEKYNHQAYIACSRGGFTNDNLAELFEVTTRTIDTWKQEYPDFLRAIKKGKDEYDTGEVENALLKRAKGFEYQEEVFELDEDKKLVKAKVIKKYLAPDTGAAAFWLKNRNPDRWRDKQEIEQKNITEIKEDYSKWTDEDLRIMAELKAKYQTDEK